LYEESFGEIRQQIDLSIREFESILDKQDKIQIEKAAGELKAFFDEIEGIYLLWLENLMDLKGVVNRIGAKNYEPGYFLPIIERNSLKDYMNWRVIIKCESMKY